MISVFFGIWLFLHGENVAEEILHHVISIANEIKHFLAKKIKMEELTALQEKNLLCATQCHICGKSFHHRDKRVKYHDHLTGKYRGPAHNACKMPCNMHNLRSYHANHIMSAVKP